MKWFLIDFYKCASLMNVTPEHFQIPRGPERSICCLEVHVFLNRYYSTSTINHKKLFVTKINFILCKNYLSHLWCFVSKSVGTRYKVHLPQVWGTFTCVFSFHLSDGFMYFLNCYQNYERTSVGSRLNTVNVHILLLK